MGTIGKLIRGGLIVVFIAITAAFAFYDTWKEIQILKGCMGKKDEPTATMYCINYITSIKKLSPIVDAVNEMPKILPCSFTDDVSLDPENGQTPEASAIYSVFRKAKIIGVYKGGIQSFMDEYYTGVISRFDIQDIIKGMYEFSNEEGLFKSDSIEIMHVLNNVEY